MFLPFEEAHSHTLRMRFISALMYHFSKFIPASYDDAIALITDAIKAEGMGILTEIDVQAAFKKKLDVDFRRYTILGACHPQVAYQMLKADDKAGVMYPCNVLVQEHADGQVEVSAVDPLMMFLMIHNPRAKEIAIEASQKMRAVIDRLPSVDVRTVTPPSPGSVLPSFPQGTESDAYCPQI